MRIISGSYRGKKLLSPDSDKVRPTSDRVRQAVYNILYSRLSCSLSELSLLDVFSGSGAFALEAVSRGIKNVAMIDLDTKALLKNVDLFPKEKSKIKVLKLDATNLPQAIEAYDLVYMDAPYNKGLSKKTLLQLAEKGWVKKDTQCIVEVGKNEKLEFSAEYELLDERVYGLAKVIFLKKL